MLKEPTLEKLALLADLWVELAPRQAAEQLTAGRWTPPARTDGRTEHAAHSESRRAKGAGWQTGGVAPRPSRRRACRRARFGQGRVLAVLASGAARERRPRPGVSAQLPAAPGGSARSLALRCARWPREGAVDGAEGASGGVSRLG
jgi:hypothetical protein